jgi:hypothetical protein
VLRVDRGRCTHHVAVALILVVALLSVACSAATPGALTPSAQDAGTDDVAPADAAPGAAEAGAAQTDWQHTLQVVANVRAQPPTQPVVYLLGGSVARECIPSEASWAVAVRAAGGPAAMTFDLASRNRTTAQDLKIVARLPEVPTILFIGVNVGRFTPAPSSPTLTLPAARQPLPPWKQHRYSTALSIAKKRALVSDWMQRRYPVFKKNYAYNLGMLEKLVKAAKAKGFHPVLLHLPRNTAVIGSAMDAPVGRYRRSCRALAAEHAIPWVDFVAAAKLKNADFYDLWHLIGSGRQKWQPLLAAKTATLLHGYGMDASPSPSPSPSDSPSSAPSP